MPVSMCLWLSVQFIAMAVLSVIFHQAGSRLSTRRPFPDASSRFHSHAVAMRSSVSRRLISRPVSASQSWRLLATIAIVRTIRLPGRALAAPNTVFDAGANFAPVTVRFQLRIL